MCINFHSSFNILVSYNKLLCFSIYRKGDAKEKWEKNAQRWFLFYHFGDEEKKNEIKEQKCFFFLLLFSESWTFVKLFSKKTFLRSHSHSFLECLFVFWLWECKNKLCPCFSFCKVSLENLPSSTWIGLFLIDCKVEVILDKWFLAMDINLITKEYKTELETTLS